MLTKLAAILIIAVDVFLGATTFSIYQMAEHCELDARCWVGWTIMFPFVFTVFGTAVAVTIIIFATALLLKLLKAVFR